MSTSSKAVQPPLEPNPEPAPAVLDPGAGWTAAFLRSPAGRAAVTGFGGAILIAIGGLGAGSTRQHDPLLESVGLSWLRFGHGLVVSSICMWLGVVLMLLAWLGLGRHVIAGKVTKESLLVVIPCWLLPLLASVPVFSRDAYSYLAQGALLRDGFDPYLVGPVENPNALLENVSPIWSTTTAPYGPLFILIARFVTQIVGDDVVAGTMLLRLCMLPGLALLVWATPRVARCLSANASKALWICVLNPLVIIHLMGGVHNEMLMVGLMMAGIALVLERHHVWGISVVALAVAVKATAGLALPFLVWIWMRRLVQNADADSPQRHPVTAFAMASAASVSVVVAVFAVLSWIAGVGLGWLTALAGSVKIINWLTVPTAVANIINVVAGLFVTVNFDALLEITRIIGVMVIAVSLPVVWWRHRHNDRDAMFGILWAMVIVVLMAPAALPWYYTWPLAIAAPLLQSRIAIAAIAGFSTWIMVIFKPDGSHGMYVWIHVLIAATCAAIAWRMINTAPEARDPREY
ncbi:alpha-(1-_6)-mannopyranosyltransferase A [Mycobacteroides chelonae]|uniref:Alpha-(1->6)-mannopyranosyltransferase A n=1 Tax=Mycobacteroides chelonae TaxID=1774 RepID=A0AB73U0P2_MYCCH|nr:alpha-(1->6)-mannopyranosyltransferase A [Mycobacteroides chelonae]